uniref:PSQ10.6c n=1 Tax=Nocardiopsis sp. 90127 TaxID=373213 RepID=Q27I82_9ACTN|nr:helix-turn-helix domain-containing protein [Nocardiopsis sp. 90127]ABD48729.1 pSQ10.6c [Nocardiopsis sp. 90127]
MSKRDKNTTTPASVPPRSQKEVLERAVAAREHQAALADRLAGVDVKRLQRAETDPALLTHADTERTRVHALELTRRREIRELEVNRGYDRLRREVEVEDAWATARTERVHRRVQRGLADADHAAKDVEAVEGALDETRPATAATKMARSQERIVTAFLLFGAAGSVLSAAGIAHALHGGTSAGVAGAIVAAAVVEVPSTLLASFVIWSQGFLQRLNRSEVSLQEEDGTTVKVDPLAALPEWTRTLAWKVVIGLLAFSVLLNVWGMAWVGVGMWGALGAGGAVIAAASALLGWAYSLQSSAIIAANLASPGVTDVLEERRRVASGADIPWQAATETPESGRPPVGESELGAVLEALLAHEDTRRQVVDVIADMETAISPFPDDAASLTGPETGSARSDLRELPEDETGAETGSAWSDQAEHEPEPVEEPETGSARSDQAEHAPAPSNAPAVRAASEAADQRRADALALWEQGWSAQEIAAQMNRDKRTVRGYLTDQGVTAAAMDQRVRERVAAYIEVHGQDVQTRPMAADLHLTRSEAKAARAALGLEHRNP